MRQGLCALRGLPSVPVLDKPARAALLAELQPLMARCEWFTVGVMAPSALSAVVCLRQLEGAMGWEALALDGAGESLDASDGPVFLKGNQSTGRFQVRRESGLGEGLLITGHSPAAPHHEDTWGPLPLDLFGCVQGTLHDT